MNMRIIHIIAAAAAIAALSGCELEETATADTKSDRSSAKQDAKKDKADDGPKLTTSQENAVDSAEGYLDFGHFSKAGLIRQLSSEYGEGFSKADAKFAADHVDVDWKAEAAEAAESYMSTGSFSRAGLTRQLTSEYGEGFTEAQAEHGVTQVGL